MASSMLFRSLARSARASTSRLLRRDISSSSALAQAQPTTESATKNVFDYHVVEDLHGITAEELLADQIGRRESKMRHFT
ncbi:hypothetical protein C0993_004969, partial [Termitomyces sp. T159_Od127]